MGSGGGFDGAMSLSGMVRLLTHHYARCTDVKSAAHFLPWKHKLTAALIAYREKEPEGYAEAGFDWVGWVGGE